MTVAQILAVIAAGLGLWSGIFAFAVKWILDRERKYLDDSFSNIAKSSAKLEQLISAGARRTEDLEKAMLRLQVEIARDYVRREDWVRFSTMLAAKFDALWARLESLKEEPKNARSEKVTD